jgi:hypothetical protein
MATISLIRCRRWYTDFKRLAPYYDFISGAYAHCRSLCEVIRVVAATARVTAIVWIDAETSCRCVWICSTVMAKRWNSSA